MPTPDRGESSGLPAVQAASEITEAVVALPAVATADWCDRAAACLTRLARSGTALVLIATIDESGRVLDHEALGAAAGRQGPERARGVGRGQPGPVGQAPVETRSAGGAALDAIRARAERLPQIGWTPNGLSQPGTGLLSSMPGGRNWRAGPVGRVWGEPAPADLLVGLVPLGEFEHGRVLIVQVAATAPGAAVEADDMVILRALLPVLGRRAVLAMGPLRSSPGQWLTSREQGVLDRLIAGRSVKQIAEEQGRSTHTIHGHVKSLHRKLGATNRGELIARAVGYFGHHPRQRAAGGGGGRASEIEARPQEHTAAVSHSRGQSA